MDGKLPDAAFRFIDMDTVQLNQDHVAAALPRLPSLGKLYREIYIGSEGVTITVQRSNNGFLAFCPFTEGEGVYVSRPKLFDAMQSCLELWKKLSALQKAPQIKQP